MFKKTFLLLSILALFSSCTFLDDAYVDRKLTDLDNRLAKIEADVLTIKFELGLVDETSEEQTQEDDKIEENTEENIEEESNEDEFEEENEEETEEEEGAEVSDEENEEESVNVLEITSPENDSRVYIDPVEFLGVVNGDVEKIVVDSSGDGYSDSYTLQNYNPGDDSFWYKSSRDFSNLALGENKYTFNAYLEDGSIESLEHTIYFIEP